MNDIITRGLPIKIDSYRAYQIYVAVKNHFNSDYDFFKYRGNVRVTKISFDKRNDRKFFELISHKFSYKEILEIFVANYIDNCDFWIGDIVSEETLTIWKSWKGRIQNFNYWFSMDCEIIFSNDIKTLFSCKNNSHPLLLKLVLQKKIMLESIVVLNELIPFLDKWNEKLKDDPLWQQFYIKCKKYTPFLGVINKEKYIIIIRKLLTSSINFDNIQSEKFLKLLLEIK